jgi:hypothetical protein
LLGFNITNSYIDVQHILSQTTNDRSQTTVPNNLPNLKTQQYNFTEQVIKLKNYRGMGRLILKALVKFSDLMGFSRVGRKRLCDEVNCEPITITRWMKKYQSDGLITYEETGWGETNKTTLLFVQHLNSHISNNLLPNINNLNNLKDRDLNTHYSEYESISTNTKKQQNVSCETKRVSAKALEAEPEVEIKRICIAWLLTETQTQYVLWKMKERGIINPASFLATMTKALSEGRWDMKDFKPDNSINKQEANFHDCAFKAQEDKNKAIVLADKRMKKEGIVCPVYNPKLTHIANYDAQQQYAHTHARYVQEELSRLKS